MKDWNTPDHHIADTEHATLHFADGGEVVIADWQLIENAPEADGTVNVTLRGWVVNTGRDTSTRITRIVDPSPRGSARLVRAELRGREPLIDLDVDCGIYLPGQPSPNTWDHDGHLFSMTWLARVLDETRVKTAAS